jgi:hypothetical protein
MEKTVEFNELIGKTAIFCGIDYYSFRLGDLTLEAIEDEEDGYRSSLQELRVVPNIPVLFRENVRIIETEIGIALEGKYGIILEIGTDLSDSYYPSFVFNYNIEKLSGNINLDSLLNTVTE